MRRLRRLWRAGGGASAVEAAIVIPLALVFLLGIEEFGRAMWINTALQYAAESAARCAAVNVANCTPNVTQYAADHAFAVPVSAPDFTCTGTACNNGTTESCGVSGNTKGVQITAAYVFTPIVPNLVPGLAITLHAKACHP